jgi:UDP-N-acetylglucosamine 2-epimerase
MKKILTIVGTRPEIIKMFPLIRELDKFFNQKIILSGQHYNKNMVNIFFRDLKIRNPDFSIRIKNKSNFIFEFGKKLVKIINSYKPEAIIYHGDTFTTLISSIVSYYIFPNIKNVHIESGYRSKGNLCIEDKIRIIVDKISKINFASRLEEKNNLNKEGIKKNVYVVGNTVIDSIEEIKKKIKKNFYKKNYVYVTIHRAENVDSKYRLQKIFKFLNFISKEINILISLHPRTKKMLKKYKISKCKNIWFVDSVKYSENLSYLSNSLFCITDSGGLQEECIIIGKKCFIPTKSTPHSHYLKKDANELIDLNINKFRPVLKKILNKKILVKKFYHKKNVSKKICHILLKKI